VARAFKDTTVDVEGATLSPPRAKPIIPLLIDVMEPTVRFFGGEPHPHGTAHAASASFRQPRFIQIVKVTLVEIGDEDTITLLQQSAVTGDDHLRA
jgi:hypothetical protein